MNTSYTPDPLTTPEAGLSQSKRFFTFFSWEKLILWGLLILGLWILRGFLVIIFVTFILSYVSHHIIKKIIKHVPAHLKHNAWLRRSLVVGIFSVFLLSIYTVSGLIFPAIMQQGDELVATVKNVDPVQKMNEIAVGYLGEERWIKITASPQYKKTIINTQDFLTTHLGDMTFIIANMIKNTASFFIQFFISIILSFIIMLDIPHLYAQFQSLRKTRLQQVYDNITPGVLIFSDVMGTAFVAQAVIAVCNTVLTYCGMRLLNIPLAELMSLFVFFCSFIPVLGVFISSVPISLVALQTHGFILMLEALGLIALIHLVEAYILNPRITGNFLKIHPLLVLIILLVSEHFFGIWGLLLGVPITVYVFRYVILDMPFPKHQSR